MAPRSGRGPSGRWRELRGKGKLMPHTHIQFILVIKPRACHNPVRVGRAPVGSPIFVKHRSAARDLIVTVSSSM